MPGSPGKRDHLKRCGWYWAAVPVGTTVALAVIVFPTVGLVGVILIAALLSVSQCARQATLGLVTGAGLPLLFVAYVNRAGPGTTCYRTVTSAGCDQHLNPLPWLLVGLCLVAAGAMAQARRS